MSKDNGGLAFPSDLVRKLERQRDDLLAAAKAVRTDLVQRAEMDMEDGGAVLNISNGVLILLDSAITNAEEK